MTCKAHVSRTVDHCVPRHGSPVPPPAGNRASDVSSRGKRGGAILFFASADAAPPRPSALVLSIPWRRSRRRRRSLELREGRKGRMEKYEVVRNIGSGNFGVAKLMRHKETKELVAMKYIERGHRVSQPSPSDLDLTS
ncbi:hypothetical protein GW17_00015227 [Ensete ventricosum]|nr:hypothetical protein GW17_00015227 [Ensete ventricosum]RZR97220.1 hypothetical protein BHM03_00026349 [Ensete ventricosum]